MHWILQPWIRCLCVLLECENETILQTISETKGLDEYQDYILSIYMWIYIVHLGGCLPISPILETHSDTRGNKAEAEAELDSSAKAFQEHTIVDTCF